MSKYLSYSLNYFSALAKILRKFVEILQVELRFHQEFIQFLFIAFDVEIGHLCKQHQTTG